MNTNMDIDDAHGGGGREAMEEEEAHWVGAVTTSSVIAGDVDRRTLQLVLSAMDCTALFIDGGAHYMGFCKQVLWQAFHVDLHDMHHPAFSINLDSTTARLPPDGTPCDVCGRSWDQRQVRHWYEACCKDGAPGQRRLGPGLTPAAHATSPWQRVEEEGQLQRPGGFGRPSMR